MPAFVLLAAAAFSMDPAGSPGIYGPPAPPVRSTPGYGASIGTEVREIISDVKDGREAGQLSRKQAKELRREAGEIMALEERYSQGGLSEPERKELQNRAEVVRAISNAKRAGLMK